MDMHHLLLWKILRNREISEIYAMMSLRVMAMSLISIFVPIYLYTLGYDIPSILLFFIVISMSHMLMSPVSAKISSKIGLKHCMLLSFLFYFLYYVMLSALGMENHIVYFTAALFGIAQALFWIPFHAFFLPLLMARKEAKRLPCLTYSLLPSQ